MRFNFKKIAALGTSILLTGLTMGTAAAANFPDGFSSSNTAIVYGASAATTDVQAAGNIQSALGTSSSTVNLGSEKVNLDYGTSSKIYLNTSLTTAHTIYTSSDLPTVLADSTFSGDVSSTVKQKVTMIAASGTGAANTGAVIFDKQPTSSVDPDVGLSLGTSASQPLYNATVTFGSAVNFTNSQSQGQVLSLFGKDYTVSADSSTTNGLVLFQSAQTVTLTQGGTSGQDSATVTIDGASHTVKLINAGSSSATISVDGSAGTSVTSGSSRTINGVSVAVTSVQSSTAGGNTAVVLIGAKKLTFKDGQQVTQGDNNEVILGTTAYIKGNVNATTSLTVAVYAKDNTHDWVGTGETFTDPVFGSFGVSNGGLNVPMDDSSRDTISVGGNGDTTLTLTMTPKGESSPATFDWATNTSGKFNLSTSSSVGSAGYQIYPYEMANLTLNDFFLTGTGSNNQYNGHMLQLQTVYNDSSTSTGDYVQFYDPISGTTYGKDQETSVSEGVLDLNVDGRTYVVNYNGTAGSSNGASVQVKYPDYTGATSFVLYPTMLAEGGESVALYEPLTSRSLTAWDGTNGVTALYFPNGNGYGSVTLAYAGRTNATASDGKWTITAGSGVSVTGSPLVTGNATWVNTVNITAGQLTWELSGSATDNLTNIYLVQPNGGIVTGPAVVVFEGKDNNNHYNAVVVESKANPAGTSSDAVGVGGIYFSSPTYFGSGTSGKQLYSNSKLNQFMDGFGTLVTRDTSTSAQPVATVSYPTSQVYSNLYLGAVGSSTTTGSGAAMVKDSDVSGLSSGTRLIVVGGSCINSVAASLLGVSANTCGSAWTSATGLGSGSYMIQSFASNSYTSAAALLVAGTDAADTTAAVSALTNQKPDVAAGKKYTGTITSSQLVTVTSA